VSSGGASQAPAKEAAGPAKGAPAPAKKVEEKAPEPEEDLDMGGFFEF